VRRNAGPPDGTAAELRTAWRRLPVLPVLRVDRARTAIEQAARLAGLGVATVELTTTTPDWPAALTALRREHPDLLIGLGTVRDTDTAAQARDAGVDFLVTPYAVPGVREAADRVPVIEGGWTPGEVAAAAEHGVAKLFPAQVGGPAHLRGLLAVMPEVEIVPTGGIALEETQAWLDAGALAVGLGSDLTRRLTDDPAAVADWVAGLTKQEVG